MMNKYVKRERHRIFYDTIHTFRPKKLEELQYTLLSSLCSLPLQDTVGRYTKFEFRSLLGHNGEGHYFPKLKIYLFEYIPTR
jgi:hypothetical protein